MTDEFNNDLMEVDEDQIEANKQRACEAYQTFVSVCGLTGRSAPTEEEINALLDEIYKHDGVPIRGDIYDPTAYSLAWRDIRARRADNSRQAAPSVPQETETVVEHNWLGQRRTTTRPKNAEPPQSEPQSAPEYSQAEIDAMGPDEYRIKVLKVHRPEDNFQRDSYRSERERTAELINAELRSGRRISSAGGLGFRKAFSSPVVEQNVIEQEYRAAQRQALEAQDKKERAAMQRDFTQRQKKQTLAKLKAELGEK